MNKELQLKIVILLGIIGIIFAFVIQSKPLDKDAVNYEYVNTCLPIIDVEPLNAEPLSVKEQAIADITNYCIEYDLPIYKTLGICILETGWFSSRAFLEGNNYCGISVAEEPVFYETKQDGLLAMVRCMKMYENMTVDEMAKYYCPVNKLQWAISVKQIIKEISEE